LAALTETVTNQTPIDIHQSQEHKRGREEFRKVQLFKPQQNIPDGWTEINAIIQVERSSKRYGKDTYEKSIYISSLPCANAASFAKGIRGHWSIENRLHWVKDVIQNEDDAGIKKDNGIENLSIIKNIAINLCRGHGIDSIKNAQIYFSSNCKKLIKIIRT
jgi:predicted transposase YbfD/YdcC